MVPKSFITLVCEQKCLTVKKSFVTIGFGDFEIYKIFFTVFHFSLHAVFTVHLVTTVSSHDIKYYSVQITKCLIFNA
jgi:hypothetical protein